MLFSSELVANCMRVSNDVRFIKYNILGIKFVFMNSKTMRSIYVVRISDHRTPNHLIYDKLRDGLSNIGRTKTKCSNSILGEPVIALGKPLAI